MEYKDYYEILDVEATSDPEKTTRAYRKLARKYHPDINPGDEEAMQRFRAINEAYQILTDPDAKAKYDQLSQHWLTHQESKSSEPFDWSQWVSGVDLTDETADLDDLLRTLNKDNASGFSDFFVAIFGGLEVGQKSDLPSKGQDYHQQVEISLEEAYTGASRILRVGNRRLEVRIPRGAQTGTKVRVRNEGGVSPDGSTKGDLYLEILVTPHPHFERIGDNLHLDLPVNLYSAVLGGEAIVPTLKGKIKLKIPPETQSGRVFRIKGQGMPNLTSRDERGDLFAKVMIVVPENLTDEEIELFEELADIRGL